MSLAPDQRQRIARVLSELALGVPVLLQGDGSDTLVAPVETLTRDRFDILRQQPEVALAITARRAEVLKAMKYDGDLARLSLPDDADYGWVRAMADPSLDLTRPMKGPFRALRDDHADPARIALALCKYARLLPAALIVPDPDPSLTRDLLSLDKDTGLPSDTGTDLKRIVSAGVPLALARLSRIHIFGQGNDFEEHYAIEVGEPDHDTPVLCRLHSACFTGDVLGSLKCDCGAQLNAGLSAIAEHGSGVLLYLNQEGRGIGLANKLRAYALQAEGFDTVEANHRLGFEDDERDLMIGAHILKQMGFSSARLMTNNPRKVERMEAAGIRIVERVPHEYGRHADNTAYLDTKARKSGHML